MIKKRSFHLLQRLLTRKQKKATLHDPVAIQKTVFQDIGHLFALNTYFSEDPKRNAATEALHKETFAERQESPHSNHPEWVATSGNHDASFHTE